MANEVVKEKRVKKTYTPKKKAQLSLAEFKAWLSGVEEMQPSNWIPNAGQWKTIRAKFEDIVEGPSVTPRDRTVYNNENPYDRQPQAVRPAGPSGFAPQPTMRAPQQPIELHNPNRPVESANTLADFAVPNGEGKKPIVGRVKTPNIDTSSGNYTAAFE